MWEQPYRSVDEWRTRASELVRQLRLRKPTNIVSTLEREVENAMHDRQWWLARRFEFALICLKKNNYEEAADCIKSSYNSHQAGRDRVID